MTSPTPETRMIWCTHCQIEATCRLTNGAEIYPHRPDLANLPFWIHDTCGNYVGCHHLTDNPTRPKGVIPTKEVRQVRKRIHLVLDPLWQSGDHRRKSIYAYLSKALGYTYHTGNLRSAEDGYKVLELFKVYKEQPHE